MNNEKKGKLSLDDFKLKGNSTDSKEALDAITGGILAACHDGTTPPPTGGGGSGPTGPINCQNYSNQE